MPKCGVRKDNPDLTSTVAGQRLLLFLRGAASEAGEAGCQERKEPGRRPGAANMNAAWPYLSLVHFVFKFEPDVDLQSDAS